MVNDPIGDLLTQIKNASMARKLVIEVPYSKMKHAVADIVSTEGYIGKVEKVGAAPKFMIKIALKYDGGEPAITGLKRMSKPGLRLYVSKKDITTVVGAMGIAIVSTPQGIMSGHNAKKQGIGGELLCTIW